MVNGGGDFIAGEGVGNFADGLTLYGFSGKGGKEGKSAPTVGGVLASEPSCILISNDQKIFMNESGFGASGCGVGQIAFGWADQAEWAVGAERVFRKADEGTELHESLIVGSWILFWNNYGSEGLEFL
jgi:hypothetical protein